MRRRSILVLALLFTILATAAPALAGTVYAPLVLDREVGGNHFTTEVRVTNSAAEPAELTYLFLPAWSDGTVPEREQESVRVGLKAHESRVLTGVVPAGALGFLEVTADESVSVTTRILGQTPEGDPRAGVDLPVVTSASLLEGDTSALLQGWSRTKEGLVTDYYLMNLAPRENVCSIAVRRRSGGLITETDATLAPLALIYFEDALGKLGLEAPSEVWASVTCENAFYSFVVLHRQDSAELVFVPPAGTGNSTLHPPSDGGPLEPAFPCPDDAWFGKTGAFHRPAVGKETRRFELPVEEGRNYAKITVDVDFIPAGWDKMDPDGNHAIFWLNRGERWAGNVYGYVNAFGPGKSFIKMSTNADLRDGASLVAYSSDAVLEMGEVYHVRYTFDARARLMETVVSLDAGTPYEVEVARFQGTTTTGRIDTTHESFFIWFGHPTGTAGPEVPTYDWLYANLCVQVE